MLPEMKERGERDSGHGDRKSGSQATPKLSDLGVNKTPRVYSVVLDRRRSHGW
jgi:hypothetical protein